MTAAVARWRDELAVLAGPDTLLTSADSEGVLDLDAAHPSGLAAFLAGRSAPLSSLFREPSALAVARRRARSIRLTATRLVDEHGVTGSHLAVGVLTWARSAAPQQVSAPVLLVPVALHARGGPAEQELELRGAIRLNSSLVRLLADAGVAVDADELVALASGGPGFTPRPALARLRQLTAGLPGLEVADRSVVGTFLDLSAGLVAALDAVGPRVEAHPVVRALVTGAADLPSPGPWPASSDAVALDLDPAQQAAVDAARSGADVVVRAPAGSGATQVAAQLLAAAAGAGLSALVVAPRRAELDDLRGRLTAAGLDGLVTGDAATDRTPTEDDAAGRLPSAAEAALSSAEQRAREGVLAAHRALVDPQPQWGTSALALLTASTPAGVAAAADPDSSPLLTPHAVALLTDEGSRVEAAQLLTEALDLGVGVPQTTETPWSGADLDDDGDALEAVEAVRRLLTHGLPHARAEMARVGAETGLAAAPTVAGWARQVDLLVAVRETLDVFVPAVYERPVEPMVAATATSQWRSEHDASMSVLDRRSWRRQAREVLRPGSHPEDLHGALVRVAAERAAWQVTSEGGGWPRVPTGLADVDHAVRSVRADLDRLAPVLAGAASGPDGDLADVPLTALGELLRALDGDAGTLDHLPRRVAVRAALSGGGLLGVLDHLRSAGLTDVDDVTAQVEELWHAAALESVWADPASVPAARERLTAARAEGRAAAARRVLEGGPRVTMTTSLALPQRVSADARYDVVLLLAAHALGLAESSLALVAAPQVVVVGDPSGPSPSALVAGLTDSDDDAPVPRAGVLPAAERVLSPVDLDRQHRRPRELVELAAVVGDDDAYPAWDVGSPWGTSAARLDHVVDGVVPADLAGDPDRLPPGPEAEVARVVDLVLEHVRRTPDESLAVLAVNRAHARRCADALRIELGENPDLTAWFARRGPSPFVVTDLARAESAVRDHVLLTVGVGMTPHRRVVHRFGRLDLDGGDALLQQAVTRAGQRLTVVSSLTGDRLDTHRTTTPGARALHRLLVALGQPVDDSGSATADLDPLLDRLRAELGSRDVGVVVPAGRLAARPDLVVDAPGGRVAVLWDGRPLPDLAAVDELLLLEAALRRVGWRVGHVTARDLAADPAAVATRLLGA